MLGFATLESTKIRGNDPLVKLGGRIRKPGARHGNHD